MCCSPLCDWTGSVLLFHRTPQKIVFPWAVACNQVHVLSWPRRGSQRDEWGSIREESDGHHSYCTELLNLWFSFSSWAEAAPPPEGGHCIHQWESTSSFVLFTHCWVLIASSRLHSRAGSDGMMLGIGNFSLLFSEWWNVTGNSPPSWALRSNCVLSFLRAETNKRLWFGSMCWFVFSNSSNEQCVRCFCADDGREQLSAGGRSSDTFSSSESFISFLSEPLSAAAARTFLLLSPLFCSRHLYCLLLFWSKLPFFNASL